MLYDECVQKATSLCVYVCVMKATTRPVHLSYIMPTAMTRSPSTTSCALRWSREPENVFPSFLD